ncbi:hypothetical protein [Clostridium sp. C2-6-12]|uniref:hypothetical protein n=1 Tax=Clostridium sp. C2-6-12 TaxID=2698832 RepID=UPI00136D8F7B|nr:hypothetical protein [Clostridium sp. C2-6-12]
MNDKSKSNNIESFSSIKPEKSDSSVTNSYSDGKEKKNEGYNDWQSVPRTYDKNESCHKHEKTATNNQWCSCNK